MAQVSERGLVEIHGLTSSAGIKRLDAGILRDGKAAPAKLNGCVGWAMGLASGSAKHFAVQLLEEGMTLAIPPENLREYFPMATEDGGFDVAFPADKDSLLQFGANLCRAVDAKGWAVIQLLHSSSAAQDALLEAEVPGRKFGSPRQEFVADFLGRGAHGKISYLKPVDSNNASQLSPLESIDHALTDVAQSVAMHSWSHLGFNSEGTRTPSMLWLPFQSRREEMTLGPEPLNEDDMEDGALEDHIKFLKRRKLCCMTWLEESGQVTLTPAPGRSEHQVTLRVAPRKVLVFRGDHMSFSYNPSGKFAVLQSWIMTPTPSFEVGKIEGHSMIRAEAMGILEGRAYPEGDRVHIMAVQSRLPGGGSGPDEYWSSLLDGTDGMLQIPKLRWDTDLYCTHPDEERVPGKCYTIHGGFCSYDEVFSFDNRFFGLPDDEAKFMSPSQRVTLEECYSVLWRGGHTKETLLGRGVGIFLGDTGSDWFPFNPVDHVFHSGGESETRQGVALHAYTGANTSVVPCRVSHCLNLVGPSTTADTACSSSLVATGVAMQWLRPRSTDPKMAHHTHSRLTEGVCGGICTQIGPGTYIAMCGLNMISAAGRCFTFDESGDGYARGEGCGLIYLKASDDENDMYDQLSCLVGTSVNQDGRSASMTAPNGPSQQACILQSMREAGNKPSDVNLAECHGTGTALGDPIEVGALRAVMEPRDTTLALTSSKSNIGHLEGAAGIAGLLKCVLMLMAGTCPPNAHCRQLNPHLGVGGFPCFFDTEAINSNLNSALTGVSSFGFGGTNGRCDIWGHARFGPNKCGKVLMNEVNQVYTICPVTLGKIDHVTGEPLSKRTSSDKIQANTLRDEFASYDISRHAYNGDYRFQYDVPTESQEEELKPESALYICGSWSGFKNWEEMDRDGDNMFSVVITLGEERYEQFEIRIDEKVDQAFYPAIDNASSSIWVEGPSVNKEHRRWLLDGRDEEFLAGSVYLITVKLGSDRNQVSWKQAREQRRVLALEHDNSYAVMGSFSNWQPMSLRSMGQKAFKGAFRTGKRGRDDFVIFKDSDRKQAIYPFQPEASGDAEQACGPDELCCGRRFTFTGVPGEDVALSLTVVDGQVTVEATSSSHSRSWKSATGWDRHRYSLIHPKKPGLPPIEMKMDPQNPGVFVCREVMREGVDNASGIFADFFQVAIDEHKGLVFHPQYEVLFPGEAIVQRPSAESDGKGVDLFFPVYSPLGGRTYEVKLDLTNPDRRQTVTWAFIDPLPSI